MEDALTKSVAPQVSSLDIEMAMSLRAAMFPKVQTWWNLDVRRHIYDFIKHTISNMHLPPPLRTPKHIRKNVYGINSKKFDRGEQMRS